MSTLNWDDYGKPGFDELVVRSAVPDCHFSAGGPDDCMSGVWESGIGGFLGDDWAEARQHPTVRAWEQENRPKAICKCPASLCQCDHHREAASKLEPVGDERCHNCIHTKSLHDDRGICGYTIAGGRACYCHTFVPAHQPAPSPAREARETVTWRVDYMFGDEWFNTTTPHTAESAKRLFDRWVAEEMLGEEAWRIVRLATTEEVIETRTKEASNA